MNLLEGANTILPASVDYLAAFGSRLAPSAGLPGHPPMVTCWDSSSRRLPYKA